MALRADGCEKSPDYPAELNEALVHAEDFSGTYILRWASPHVDVANLYVNRSGLEVGTSYE